MSKAGLGMSSLVCQMCAFLIGSSPSMPGGALFQVWQHGFGFLASVQLYGEAPLSPLLLNRSIVPESPDLVLTRILPLVAAASFPSKVERAGTKMHFPHHWKATHPEGMQFLQRGLSNVGAN